MKIQNTFRPIAALLVLFFFVLDVHAQPPSSYDYVIVEVNGTGFFSSRALRVTVDFGDSPQQQAEGQKYSAILSELGTRAAVLNYMTREDFELVETKIEPRTSDGTSSRASFFFIMRKVAIDYYDRD